MGLTGTTNTGKATYLSVAGGFIWDKTKGEEDPNYAEQTYTTSDGEGTRKGAQYADLTGMVIGVDFRTHDKYGQSIRVSVESGEEKYIISIAAINNQYSTSFMKALLMMDLDKPLFIKPYDFTGSDGRRAQGISFRQDGTKLDLKESTQPPAEFKKDKAFFQNNKKEVKRFFEDLSEWYVGEVYAKICPNFADNSKVGAEIAEVEKPVETEARLKPVAKAPEAEVEVVKISTVKMKKAIKAYIAENYEGETLPKLTKEEVSVWYNLALAEEELPFPDDNQVSQDDIDASLKGLLG